MIINNKLTYKCEHCRKLYQIQSACEKHEKACSKNPENDRACFGCVHLSKKEYKEFGEEYTADRTYNFLYCDKLQHFLYPPIVEHKGSALDTDDTANEPMPKVCELKEGYKEDSVNFDELDNLGW